ncbi:concanavalin A-like lectin/glucanase [Colletotrichum somersetense]|nr:concanavalin A-like lectin/glucanase [Colletotrichum somersetense]
MASAKLLLAGATLLLLLVSTALLGDAGGTPNPAGDSGSRPSHYSPPSSAGSRIPLQAPLVSQSRPAAIHDSRNWAGGVNARPPIGTRFAAAKMNFTLPTTLGPDVLRPESTYYAGTAWVGIDGWHRAALLQVGVTFVMNKTESDEIKFLPFYEWTPAVAKFMDISMRPGDKIEVEAVMFNATQGKVYLRNLSSGEWVARVLNAPQPDARLAGANVEWIVEDFRIVWEPDNVAFADFGVIELKDCVAYTTDGEKVGPDQGEVFRIRQGNETRARATVNGTSVAVEYTRDADLV